MTVQVTKLRLLIVSEVVETMTKSRVDLFCLKETRWNIGDVRKIDGKTR